MIVYLTKVVLALFLFRQEKGEKKPIQGGLFTKTPPLYNPLRNRQGPWFLIIRAEMYRFPPIRPQMHQTSGRKSGHFLPEQDLS